MNWKLWIKGLAAAVIGGAANSVSAMIVAPESFNIHDLPKVGQLCIAAAIVSACLYLKQSPLPQKE